MRTLEDILGPVPDADEIEERAARVARINERHAFIYGKGVIREERDGTTSFVSVREFEHWLANTGLWTRTERGADKFESDAKIWMQSPARRQYTGMVMDPRGKSPGAYNLWKGFSYKPSRNGSCERYLDHIHDHVCRGNGERFDWVMGWMAHTVQRPWEKPGTAIVMKGVQGAGKSIVAQHFGALMRHHHVTVYTPRGMLGQFNSHTASALLVQVEEGFWAGDKAAEGALKHLITGPTVVLEKKGVDAIELPSFHRYMMTSNERWTVPARHDERRYCVLDVSDARARDGEYFGAISREMEEGGYGALMRYLLDYDLSRVDVRTIPQTEALAVEKLAGLRGIQAWWHEVLAAGVIPCEGRERFDRDRPDWREQGASVRADELRSALDVWLRGRRHHGDILTAELFGRELRDMCPSMKRTQRREGAARTWFYDLPPLHDCRVEFTQWLGSKVEWG
jgi:hypothetical protein